MNDIQATNRMRWIHIAILSVSVCIVYYKVLYAPFSTWDDSEYVVNNPDIRGINLTNISAWFTSFYIGNYHPLTMLSYAFDFAIGKQNPFVYHLTNIVLHTANALIVYFLIARIGKNTIVALFTALIFAVHPVQTESVSWIAERKTVLCALFYLLALMQYTSYVTRPLTYKLALLLLFSIAAMLSKGTAVSLPLSIIAVHICIAGGIKDRRLWLAAGPLFIAALITGIVAIRAQASGNWLGHHAGYNWWDTTLLAAHAYVQYIFNLLAPFRLSVMYPYPEIGIVQYMYLAISIGIVTLGFIAWRKQWHILFGGILFYTVNIVFVLQFVQFGDYIMADRYLYIAGIGIIFPIVYYPVTWFQKKGKLIIAIASCTLVAGILLVATFLRNDIWLSDLNFFNAMLRAFPNSSVAQYSVGALYIKNGDFANAEGHINEALRLDPRNYKAWYNRGVLYLRQGKVNESLDALSKCLSIHSYPEAYFSRALIYMSTGRYAPALADAESVLAAQPAHSRAWYIKGYCMEQQANWPLAIECYTKAITLEHNESLFYMRRGKSYAEASQFIPALTDLNQAIALNPGYGEALYYRGAVKYNMKENPCPDLYAATSKGYKVPAHVLAKLCP